VANAAQVKAAAGIPDAVPAAYVAADMIARID
jgi:hypothetical protein